MFLVLGPKVKQQQKFKKKIITITVLQLMKEEDFIQSKKEDFERKKL